MELEGSSSIFAELAALPPLEYEQRRQAVAKDLGFRVSVLDREAERLRPKADSGGLLVTDQEPWPDEVNLDELLNEIANTLRRFIVMPPESVTTVSLWAVLTFIFDSFEINPYLAIVSPEKKCGKTTLLKLLLLLVCRPLPTSNCTPATIFRVIPKYKPTLLIDEADTFLNGDSEMKGILNSGHTRETAVVFRTTGDDQDVKGFSTWCGKAIAAIGKLPATIMDRSFVIAMRRKVSGEKVESLRFVKVKTELDPIRRKAARWATDNFMSIGLSDPAVPSGLDDREVDCWEPMLAIAEAAGGNWPKLAHEAALALSESMQSEDDSLRTVLLEDIQNIFESESPLPRMRSQDLVDALNEMKDRPWPELNKGKPITQNKLARLLKPFGIKPTTIRFPDKTQKGYELDSFKDAFLRYIPSASVTPS
jgi:putative DNA primase/helicase